jgi:hypothetical protein
MESRRLGRGAYLGVWTLLIAVQLALFWVLVLPFATANRVGNELPTLPASAWGALVIVGVLQVVKVVPTMWRLGDMGRSPDDALWGLVPLGNLVLWSWCLAGTPSEKIRDKRRANWVGQIGAFAAWIEALRIASKSLVVLPFVVAFGLISGVLGYEAVHFLDRVIPEDVARKLNEAAARELQGGKAEAIQIPGVESLVAVTQAGYLLIAILVAFTVLQAFRYQTASRASWWPATLIFPVLLGTGLCYALSTGIQSGMGLLIVAGSYTTASVLWYLFFGTALAILTVRSAQRVTSGQPVELPALVREVGSRLFEVMVPHGVKILALTIGKQFFLPGVFYSLQYGFVEHLAVLEPSVSPTARSAELTSGIRSRLFKIMAIGVMLYAVPEMVLSAALDGPAVIAAAVVDARQFSRGTMIIGDLWFVTTTWLQWIALYVVYLERETRQKAADAA